MEKIVGFDIGESSVKLVYFAGADLKKAVTAELPDNMVSGSRILSMDAMADFLRQTAKGLGPSTRIYTAHHADDNAETVLHGGVHP